MKKTEKFRGFTPLFIAVVTASFLTAGCGGSDPVVAVPPTNLLSNGDFELPGLADGVISGNFPTGWTGTAPGGTYDSTPAGFGYASGNDRIFFFQPTVASTAYQNTTVNAVVGERFTFSVDIGNRGGTHSADPLAANTFIAIAKSDGTVLQSLTILQSELSSDNGTQKTFSVSHTVVTGQEGLLRVIVGTGPDATPRAYADFDNAVLIRNSQ